MIEEALASTTNQASSANRRHMTPQRTQHPDRKAMKRKASSNTGIGFAELKSIVDSPSNNTNTVDYQHEIRSLWRKNCLLCGVLMK